jgi:hypothetical protein
MGLPADYPVVAHFLSASEAAGAVAALQGAGLSPRLRDAQLAGLNWLYTPALGGVRLEVPASEEGAARALLASSVSDATPLTPEDEAYYAATRRRYRNRGLWALLLTAPWLFVIGLLLSRLSRAPTAAGRGTD